MAEQGHKKETKIDIPLAIVLALFPWGWDKMKLPEGPIVGLISWGICLLFVARIFWIVLPGNIIAIKALVSSLTVLGGAVLLWVFIWPNVRNPVKGEESSATPSQTVQVPPSERQSVPSAKDIAKELSKLQAHPQPDSGLPYPRNLSVSALCDAADKLAVNIRSFNEDYRFQEAKLSADEFEASSHVFTSGHSPTPEEREKAKRISLEFNRKESALADERMNAYERRFRTETNLIRDEILSRLPREERYSDQTVSANNTIKIFPANNWFTINIDANEIQRVSDMLRGTVKH
jgi:hypothetical protein